MVILNKMKNQLEVEVWFNINSVINGDTFLEIEKILKKDGLEWPSNITLSLDGATKDDFLLWYETENCKYPNTFEDCKLLYPLINNCTQKIGYQNLLYCRDVYWMIAGNWKPNWQDASKKYVINASQGKLNKSIYTATHFDFAFPTEEIRDIFFENFKEELEKILL